MNRYFALVSDPGNSAAARKFTSLRARWSARTLSGWSIACDIPGIFAVHAGPSRQAAKALPLDNNGGIVLGTRFRSDSSNEAGSISNDFTAGETRKILDSGGRRLIEKYWGSYIAILWDDSTHRHHVFRDPVGNAACYRIRHEDVDIFFSHIDDFVNFLPIHFSINRRHLARRLVFSRFSSRDTGIENVENLPPGECLCILRGDAMRTQLWDPAAIAATPRLEKLESSAKALRETVERTVDAWASCYGNITLRLSGGLDSSILAACLASASSQPRVTYFNIAIDGLGRERLHLPGIDAATADKLRAIAGHGDERYFARLVAQRWNAPLVQAYRSQAMDLRRLRHTPMTTQPSMYFTVMENDDAELDMVRSHGTEAFFSGQAGDSVFLATSQPIGAIDYAFMHGCSKDLWEQLRNTAKLSRESLWTVLGKTIRHGVLSHPYRSPVCVWELPTLLNKELADSMTAVDFASHLHSLEAYAHLPPGKKNHVAGVAGSAYYDFVFDSGEYADHIDPLNSQPVWELMLQVPSYTALAGGVSRGLARIAFADVLPAEIRKRQMKGVGGPFYQQVVRRNRDHLREQLIDGQLVTQGYLDRKKLVDCLAAEEPSMIIPAPVMLNYLAAEIWLRRWTQTQHSQHEILRSASA